VNLSVENYAYTFIQKSSGHEVRVEAREDIFPERFFDLRKKCKTGTATSEEKKAFKYAKEDLKSAFLYLPEARVFAFSFAPKRVLALKRVPALTPIGIIALITILSVVLAVVTMKKKKANNQH